MTSTRKPLPTRRPSVTQTLGEGGQNFTVTIGFDPSINQPRELFLSAGKEGSMLSSLLADAATVVSIALQYGIPPEALLKSLGRQPVGPVAPADLDKAPAHHIPASPLGAALDLLVRWEGANETSAVEDMGGVV